MDLKITRNAEMTRLAPERLKKPESLEDLLTPLTMRERVCVCAMADSLFDLGKMADELRTDELFVRVSKRLLVTFKDVTGVSWADAMGLFPK